MKKLALVSLTAAMLLVGVSISAWADGGRHGHGGHGYGGHGHYRGHSHGHSGSHFGFYFGVPLFWGSYPYDYYPYYRRRVYVVEPPPVYIQRQPQAYVQQPSGYWYYCPNPSGYYPYVQSCPTQWVQVAPQSPSQ